MARWLDKQRWTAELPVPTRWSAEIAPSRARRARARIPGGCGPAIGAGRRFLSSACAQKCQGLGVFG